MPFRLGGEVGPISEDAAPHASGTHDPGAQALHLHELAVVDEQVHFGAIVLAGRSPDDDGLQPLARRDH